MKRAVLVLAFVVTALFMASGVALAALENMPDSGTVGTNGRVYDILRAGDKIYLAGSFTQIVNPDGTTVPRSNLAAIDATTGQLTDWNPNVTNATGTSNVHEMTLSSDGTRLFIGGNFQRVGGLYRVRLAAIDLATGKVDSKWRVDADNTVYALGVSGDKLYVGGAFKAVAGQPRERLAAINQAAGTLDPGWTPRAYRDDDLTSQVRAMDVSEDGTRIYVGGFFNYVSGTYTRKLAAIDAATGELITGFNPADSNNILDMDVSGGSVYVAAGDLLEGVEAFDAESGQLKWSVAGGYPDPQAGDVQAIIASGNKVYAGGHFGQMGGLVRKRLLELDAQTGQIGPWAPQVAGDSTNLGVWALQVDPATGRLYAGGDFTQIGGSTYRRFAQFFDQQACTITGTSSDDVLEGTAEADVICAGAGNDTIKGLGGADIIRGEGGSDKLYGGEGDDRLEGGIGTDLASYNSSTAGVSASLGTNSATGEGTDTFASIENLEGSNLADTLAGSTANNRLTGLNGADSIFGLDGADTLLGVGGGDDLKGGLGNDTVTGGSLADLLYGEEGDDTLDSRDSVGGNDSLDGGTHTNGDTCLTDAAEKSIVNCEL
jgi:Ca2+-binding RTX toxin-like protein